MSFFFPLPLEIYPRSPALLFRCHKPPPIHTSSVNGEPNAKSERAPSAIGLWDKDKSDLVKGTGTGHKMDVSTRRRSTLTRLNISFGLQSLVERERRRIARTTLRHSALFVQGQNVSSAVLNSVAMRTGGNALVKSTTEPGKFPRYSELHSREGQRARCR
jgi:hypothetical protein